ncbi:hypothetical protein ACROYT_G034340 [Oculina patagonica]
MATKGIAVFVFFCILAVAFGKPNPQPCVVDGQTIQPGARFYMDCNAACTCGGGDAFWCVPLCPLENYNCSPGTQAMFENMVVDAGGKECRCPRFVGCSPV